MPSPWALPFTATAWDHEIKVVRWTSRCASCCQPQAMKGPPTTSQAGSQEVFTWAHRCRLWRNQESSSRYPAVHRGVRSAASSPHFSHKTTYSWLDVRFCTSYVVVWDFFHQQYFWFDPWQTRPVFLEMWDKFFSHQISFTKLSSPSVWKGWSSKWSTCLMEDTYFGKSTKPFGFNKKTAP